MSQPYRVGQPRLILDTNVLISAALTGRGPAAQLLEAAGADEMILVASPALLEELGDVLTRQEFRKWLSLDDVSEYLEPIEQLCYSAADPDTKELCPVCRDPKDDYFVFLSEDIEATLLVSGAQDLLQLNRVGVDVRNPQDAIAALRYERT